MPNQSSLRKHDESEGGGPSSHSLSSWITVVSLQSAIALVLSLSPAIVANFASSLRTGEALIAVTLLSLGLWGAFCSMASWIAAAL